MTAYSEKEETSFRGDARKENLRAWKNQIEGGGVVDDCSKEGKKNAGESGKGKKGRERVRRNKNLSIFVIAA